MQAQGLPQPNFGVSAPGSRDARTNPATRLVSGRGRLERITTAGPSLANPMANSDMMPIVLSRLSGSYWHGPWSGDRIVRTSCFTKRSGLRTTLVNGDDACRFCLVDAGSIPTKKNTAKGPPSYLGKHLLHDNRAPSVGCALAAKISLLR